MNEISFQDSHIGRLAEHLTELVSRLRLSSSLESGSLVLPPFLTRLETASRLLAYAGTVEKSKGFQRLGSALPELISFLEENPGSYLRELDRPLELLADHMDTVLSNIDAGESIASVAADLRWAEILSRFESAGTTLAVMGDLEQTLARWEATNWSTGIGPDKRGELHRRWVALRSRGDLLFEKPVLAGASRPNPALMVQGMEVVCGLLLDSPFQRDQLLQKIRMAGSRAVVLTNYDQAAKLSQESKEGLVFLVDNLEPTRNLEKVLASFPAGTPEIAKRCILVSGSGLGRNELQRRAKALTAMGVWTPPFDLGDLQKILDDGITNPG